MGARDTCLIAVHRRRVAPERIADFGGFRLPLWFAGAVAEHRAVRTALGVFDATHMGVLGVEGAAEGLDALFTNRLSDLAPGRSRYGFFLREEGSVLDDAIVYRQGPDRFLVVANAANAEAVLAHLGRGLPGHRVENLRDAGGGAGLVDVPVQGPRARGVLAKVLGGSAPEPPLEALPRGGIAGAGFRGRDVWLARTGYTGEPWGFEVFVPPDLAEALFEAVLGAGGPAGAAPCGLAARDSLRTEAGLPLYGHELAGPQGLDPIEAGLGRFVKIEKPFLGREALAARRPAREVVRFRLPAGSRKAKPGDPVADARGRVVGFVTSCALACTRWVGLAGAEKGSLQTGDSILIVPIPERDPGPAKSPSALRPGDRIALPLVGEVRLRFPLPEELVENLGG